MRAKTKVAPNPDMQQVVDDLRITRAEAGAMIRAGLEQAAIGALLYGMFVSGEVDEPAVTAPAA